MKSIARVVPVVALPLVLLAGCRSRTDRSEGTVLLSVSDFDELPIQVSVSSGPYQIGQITLRNVAKHPTGTVSPLQDIERRSYGVRFTRLDNGSRQIVTLVEPLFGNVSVGSTAQFDNLPFVRPAQ